MSAPTCPCGTPMRFDTYGAFYWCEDDACPRSFAAESARHLERMNGGEKGFHLGARIPQTRAQRVIEEWDAAAYERENPLRKI